MRILILGSNGMLGSICKKYFIDKKYIVNTFDKYFSFDQSEDYFNELKSYNSDLIINCIGKIKQKTDNFSDLMTINSVYPNLLSMKKNKGSILVQPSTDCVFAGDLKNRFYQITDFKDAVDAYGLSKAFGENALANRNDVLVLRGSIIGLVKGKSESLMDWFLAHSDGDTVDGYDNHLWNGITTLQWCKCLELLITYKKNNLNKDEYLNEKSINEAIKWFHEKYNIK